MSGQSFSCVSPRLHAEVGEHCAQFDCGHTESDAVIGGGSVVGGLQVVEAEVGDALESLGRRLGKGVADGIQLESDM
jgi:hypothetical protein